MSDLVELLHGLEELRFCSALAILIQFEGGEHRILRGLLERIISNWCCGNGFGSQNRPCPLNKNDLKTEVAIQNVHVQVEEPIAGGRQEGRLDLTVRFGLLQKNFLVIFEAKVVSSKQHGSQLNTYRRQFSIWDAEKEKERGERNRIFGLLTLVPKEKLVDLTDDDREMVDFAILWKDVLEILEKEREISQSLSPLIDNFRTTLRRWYMELKDYAKPLEAKEPPFPVLLDALEALCRRLLGACEGGKLQSEPSGWQGPVWEDPRANEKHDGCYWCGYWWRVNQEYWTAVYIAWYYEESKEPTGYTGKVEFWAGKKGSEGELKKDLSLLEFQKLIGDEKKLNALEEWLKKGRLEQFPI